MTTPFLLALGLTIASAIWIRMFLVDLKRGVIRHPRNWTAPVQKDHQPRLFNLLKWLGFGALPILIAMITLLWMAAISRL